jgi:hypothetical protein
MRSAQRQLVVGAMFLALGAMFLALGTFAVLGGIGSVRVRYSRGSPPWAVALLGLMFLCAGLLALSTGATSWRRGIALIFLGSLTVLFGWVGFGPGDRPDRGVFGAIALLFGGLFVLAVTTSLRATRRDWSRNAGSGASSK